MDYFEDIVGTLLEAEGYWVRRAFKVNLTKEEKRAIGKHSIPRPEIDLIALDFKKNTVVAMEVKSYLDSGGVNLDLLREIHEVPEGRYKIFTSKGYRQIVVGRLLKDLAGLGMANSKTKITLGLAAGKVHRDRSGPIRDFMSINDWIFWSPEDIKDKVKKLAALGYENNPTVLAAKILMR